MKKLLFSLMVLSGLIGIVPALQAQGTLTVPPPPASPRATPQPSAHRVTLDVDASAQKATQQKSELKTSKSKTEQKKAKPKAVPATGRTNGQ
ncbi:hypothetical protein [Hymenobacter volaticus]|uniref:Uncharacterized protein n=1 Tax=Hymenobacter volaticus TaxID=2932254 RepID=A0ABY4G5K6_9BACT|nr:hypothetical protein [Hymenobacter volaticus]UOQ66179.1 hypothetical protein MUN86_22240 [Hymenobacter volaticus]